MAVLPSWFALELQPARRRRQVRNPLAQIQLPRLPQFEISVERA